MKNIGYDELDTYINRLKNIKKEHTISDSIVKYNGTSSVKNNTGKLGFDEDSNLANGENTILDLRANGVRIYSGSSNISNGKQEC